MSVVADLPLLLAELANRSGDRMCEERFRESEARIRRAFGEIFRGYDSTAEDVLNEVVRVDRYDGVVTVSDITFYSYCEHHFAPFFGTASVSYQPGNIITGIGKLARLVRDVHASRLQVQELMTRDIAEDLMRVLQARGALVITEAAHLCMCSRGPRSESAKTRVSYGVGSLALETLLAKSVGLVP